MTAAKRLLQELHSRYRNFADLVVYDSLACNSPWINISKVYGIDFVVRVNDKRLKIVKGANAIFRGKDVDIVWDINKSKGKEVTVSVCETEMQMNGVEEPVRYIKFLKKTKDRETVKSEFS
ncbi:MAG: hypothetical protein PHG64_11290 [Paludibacter sp.]|nr:hypothetical protein [Paludibacter sp.]